MEYVIEWCTWRAVCDIFYVSALGSRCSRCRTLQTNRDRGQEKGALLQPQGQCPLVIIQWSIIIDHRIERVSISINRSQSSASIIIEINSKKYMFWHISLDLFWPSFSPKTVPENVQNIAYLAVEIANKCCWDESARNWLWLIIDRLYPTNDRSWKSQLIPITSVFNPLILT